jgi:hypothetical protein
VWRCADTLSKRYKMWRCADTFTRKYLSVEVCRHIYEEISMFGGVQTHLAGDIQVWRCADILSRRYPSVEVCRHT